jgi:hypothetical protein
MNEKYQEGLTPSDPLGKLSAAIKNITKQWKNITKGFGKIKSGLEGEFPALNRGLGRAVNDMSYLSTFIGEFLTSHLKCVLQFIVNFSACAKYYIADICWDIFCVIPRLIVYCTWLFIYKGIYQDITHAYDNIMIPMDKQVKSAIGFSFLTWPDDVRRTCYMCIRLKKEVLNKKSQQVNNDLKVKLPADLKRPTDEFIEGKNMISSSLKSIFGIK